MLARIVRAGHLTPSREFGLGLARLPVETTAKLWEPHQILLLFSSVQRLVGDQSRPCMHG